MVSKTILVTGGNRSIGFCIAQLLAQQDSTCTVLVGGRTIKKAEEAVGQLKESVPNGNFLPLELDVSDDTSIRNAANAVKDQCGKLDVLINNAGIASVPQQDLSDYRAVFASILDTNVTAVGLVTSHFLPLLRASKSPATNDNNEDSTDPRVINISSGRASLTRLTTGALPPTASIPYSVSKAAANALTLELGKQHADVTFQLANPGHCRTAFNGFRGKREPAEGAEVVVALALAPRGRFRAGFWETVEGEMREVPW